MSILDSLEEHEKIKANRIRGMYQQMLAHSNMDRNIALLHAAAFMTHIRDFMMIKMQMPSDRLDIAIGNHFVNEGYERATRFLTEDFRLYRDKVMQQNIGAMNPNVDRVGDLADNTATNHGDANYGHIDSERNPSEIQNPERSPGQPSES